jgi:hypothetical protein
MRACSVTKLLEGQPLVDRATGDAPGILHAPMGAHERRRLRLK